MDLYIHVILLSNKKEWNLTICNDINGPRDYYAKWNKLVIKRQMPYDLTYVWNLKNKTNEQTKQKRNRLIDTKKTQKPKMVVTRGGRSMRGLDKIGAGE